jgi:N-acetylmuramoyl-L-alanine amidase
MWPVSIEAGVVRPRLVAVVIGAVVCALLWSLSTAAVAASPQVLRVRYWTAPDHTRVVLDLTRPGSYTVRRFHDPDRLTIEVQGARLGNGTTISVGDGLISRIRRLGLRGKVQIVLDLQKDVHFRHFALPAADGRPDRVVVDVLRGDPSPRSQVATRPVKNTEPVTGQAGQVRERSLPAATKPFTVILDPGHGGMDPGAIRNRVQEKDVVLNVCRETARLINQIPGYRAVLTRDRDYFLSLGRRVRIAKEKNGDIFLSIHANTHPKRGTSGMEVYFLSLKGATDREAKELADKENAADLVGLDPGERRDDSVLAILMDLHMTRVLNQSSRLAESIMTSTKRSGVVGTRRVKQARFQVLSSLAMPSALIELAYLSNTDDRKLLASRQGQRDLAQALVAGILGYRSDQEALALTGITRSWNSTHQVRRGDSLWELARRYDTTIDEIRTRNNLRSSQLLIGQKLRVPNAD